MALTRASSSSLNYFAQSRNRSNATARRRISTHDEHWKMTDETIRSKHEMNSNETNRRAGLQRVKAAPGTDGTTYVAKNTFLIAQDENGSSVREIKERFLREIDSRERLMKGMEDYVQSSLRELGSNEYEFSQEWKTKAGYEKYMNTPERRKSHFPVGVYQYLPKDKWSVPENFAPVIKTKDAAKAAKA